MENQDPSVTTTGSPETPVSTVAITPAAPAFSWKTQLPADYQNAPSMKVYPDTKEGFANVIKTHLELEKLLGHEKVPIPKDKNDLAARSIFNKALGIPDKPEEYGLEDVSVPENLKGLTFDKTKFAEIAHKYNMRPDDAKGLWKEYTDLNQSAYAKALGDRKTQVTNLVNQLRGEWGDAYQTKVELGQMVINKFGGDKDSIDFITAVSTSDPRLTKFLATLGDQFAENKIGEFKYQRHSYTAEEAQKEIDGIRQDPKHPYNNDRASQAERDKAIDYVNNLITVVNKAKTTG